MLTDLAIESFGGWEIATARARGRWLAWAKQGQIVAADPIREPGDVWFNFGTTREEASARIKAEVLS